MIQGLVKAGIGKAIRTLGQREQEVRADLMTRNHMSKHTVEGAAATMRKEHGLGVDYMTRGFEKHLETKKPIDVWKEAVEDNFDQLGGGYQESDGGRGTRRSR